MAGSIFYKKKKGQKKNTRPPPWCSHNVQYCTMTLKKGAVASQFLHLDWDLFSSLVSLEAGISSIKSMIIYCDSVMFLWLKKSGKSRFFFCLFFLNCTSYTWWPRQLHCMVTSKSIYFLKKIKYDHENRHTFNYKINHYEHNLQGCHSLNA